MDDANDGWAIQRIAEDPDLKAEAIANLPVLKAAAYQKAGRAGVRDVIGRRFALYPQPNRSEGEWAAWWADYLDVLADVPWHALEAGMAAYVADPKSEFMPKPGKIRELAMTAPARVAIAYTRASRVAAIDQTPAPTPEEVARAHEPRERTDEDRKAIREMADEVLGKLKVKTMGEPAQRSNLPSTAGKPDVGGLTPAMRELLAKQRGADA